MFTCDSCHCIFQGIPTVVNGHNVCRECALFVADYPNSIPNANKHCEFCHAPTSNIEHIVMGKTKIHFRTCKSCWNETRINKLKAYYRELTMEALRNEFHPRLHS